MLPNNIKPYVPHSFDETSKRFGESIKIKDEAYEEGFNLGKQKGYTDGFNVGYDEGLKKGYSEGLKNAENELKQKISKLENTAQILGNMIDEFENFREREFKKFLPQILDFAMKIAEKVVSFKIYIDREVIISIVKEALQNLPLQNEKILIKLNPEDYRIIIENLSILDIDRKNLSFEPSDSVEKGGYLIETKSQYIESTIQDRFKEIENALNSILSE